jgi:hypothetical protein
VEVEVEKLLLQLMLSAIGAIGFDWVLQFRVQLMYSGAISGGGPRPYRIGPPFKIGLMILYLLPLNWMILSPYSKTNLLWILFVLLFLTYSTYAVFLAVRMIKQESS